MPNADALTAIGRLVGMVAAVEVVIADKMFRDALFVLALELAGITGLVHWKKRRGEV